MDSEARTRRRRKAPEAEIPEETAPAAEEVDPEPEPEPEPAPEPEPEPEPARATITQVCVFCQDELEVDPVDLGGGRIVAEPAYGIRHFICKGCDDATQRARA